MYVPNLSCRDYNTKQRRFITFSYGKDGGLSSNEVTKQKLVRYFITNSHCQFIVSFTCCLSLYIKLFLQARTELESDVRASVTAAGVWVVDV